VRQPDDNALTQASQAGAFIKAVGDASVAAHRGLKQ
jgi:hypothetical protein